MSMHTPYKSRSNTTNHIHAHNNGQQYYQYKGSEYNQGPFGRSKVDHSYLHYNSTPELERRRLASSRSDGDSPNCVTIRKTPDIFNKIHSRAKTCTTDEDVKCHNKEANAECHNKEANAECHKKEANAPTFPMYVGAPPGAKILTGEGAPDACLGKVGDLYIDTVTGFYYVKLCNGGWTFEGPNGDFVLRYWTESANPDPQAVWNPKASYFAPIVNVDATVEPLGTGSIRASQTGNPRGAYAADFQRVRSDPTQMAGANTSVISGGQSNKINSNVPSADSVIAGGNSNLIDVSSGSGASVISGGSTNSITGDLSAIVGGVLNVINDFSSTSIIGGGAVNIITNSDSSVIGGGDTNVIEGDDTVIAGGNTNQIFNDFCVISGGQFNLITGRQSNISGGASNTISGSQSGITSGEENVVSANFSVITGGNINNIMGANSVIGGGNNNTVNDSFSGVFS